jgi:hypothetical protein
MKTKHLIVRSKFIQYDENNHLLCYKCGHYLPLDNFDNNCENWYRSNKDRRCKECRHIQFLKRKELDRNRISLDRILVSRWNGIKERSKKNGYNIDFDYLYLKELWNKQEGKCAISGLNMTYEIFKGRIFTNVSVDRIDSNKGYTKNNVQLVCMAINQMKSDMSIEELLYFCEHIVYNNGKIKN